jgi:hypothetical protein
MIQQNFKVGMICKADTEAVKQQKSWMRHLDAPLVGGEVVKVLGIETKADETYLRVQHNKMRSTSTFNARYFKLPTLKSKTLTND